MIGVGWLERHLDLQVQGLMTLERRGEFCIMVRGAGDCDPVAIDSHTIVDQPLHNLEERLALLDKNAMTHHFPI